jgi:hypothetical protein
MRAIEASRHAARPEGGDTADDDDRATDFEALGGKLIDLPTSEGKSLAEAA